MKPEDFPVSIQVDSPFRPAPRPKQQTHGSYVPPPSELPPPAPKSEKRKVNEFLQEFGAQQSDQF